MCVSIDFYAPTAAFELAQQFAKDLRITILRGESDNPTVSGTQLRTMLADRRVSISPKLMDPTSVSIIRNSLFRGLVIMLVGLSGSGKTSLALSLKYALGGEVSLLDGDEMRSRLSPNLGFTKEDRLEHLNRMAYITAEIAKHGGTVIVSTIAPFKQGIEKFKKTVAMFVKKFVLVYLNTSLADCTARDPKGLYAKARLGELPTLSGAEAPYEPPIDPDLVIDGKVFGGIETSVQLVLQCLHELVYDSVEEGEFGTTNYAVFVTGPRGQRIDPFSDLPHSTNPNLYTMVTEIPQNTLAKMEYSNGAIRHDLALNGTVRFVPSGIPGNYGFIPQTLAGDGDPLDIIVVTEPSRVGTVCSVFVIGIIYFTDNEQEDHKIVAGNHSDEIPEIVVEWFKTYKQPIGIVTGVGSRSDALKYIELTHMRWRMRNEKDEL